MTDIVSIYKTLLQYPNVPKSYRTLRDYYRSIGMVDEAAGFTTILRERFNEQPVWEDADVPNTCPE